MATKNSSTPAPNSARKPDKAGTDGQEDVELSLQITERMLRTLAAVNIGKVPFDQALAMLKQAYVQAAIRHLERTQPDKRLTRSAIALLTGLDGRTVANLLAPADQREDESQEVQQSPHAHVLGSWASHNRWRDPDTGRPRRLPIYGAGDTFQALVKSVIGKSVSYSLVLETLIDNGNVRKLDDNRVELVERLFRSKSDVSRKRQSNRMVYGLGKNIVHYLESNDADADWPRGMVWNQRVKQEKLAELRECLRELLVSKHTFEVGELIDTCAEQDDRPGQATAGIGWYYWEDV